MEEKEIIQRKIITKCRELNLIKNEKSLLASADYIAGLLADKKETQEQISKRYGISQVALRKNYKKIVEMMR